MMDFLQARDAWHDFESRCHAARSEQISRIKDDRSFLSGNQWGDDDNELIAKNRPRRTINVLLNSINAVRNQYSDYPFQWYTGNDEVDVACENFLKDGNNARAAKEALLSSISFGVGAICIGTESKDGTEMPCIYAPTDICNVYLDPDSLDADGGDALEGAIVEMRSREWVRRKYGDDIAGSKGMKPGVRVTEELPGETLPVVTYFVKEGDTVTMYRLCNGGFVEDPAELSISRIPIFPVYGERIYMDDGTALWQGIVAKGKPVQKVINYAFTQLAERLAVAPKPTFITTVDAVEGIDEGYKNFSKNLNPLLLYNRTTEDGSEKLEPPQRLDNSVAYGDVSAIISSNLELMSSITGVNSKGIIDTQSQLTATEVEYNERLFATNIKHYFDNLRDTFKAVGECVLEMLGVDLPIEVIQGPGERMERQIARTELAAIGQMVSEDQKRTIVNGILMTHGDNAILREVYGELNKTPQPTAMEKQAFETIEQMKAAIQERDQKMQEMQKQIDFYENSQRDQALGYQAQMLQSQQAHKNELETIAFKAAIENNGIDAQKAQAELEKENLELQKKAVELDKAKMDAAADLAEKVVNNVL